MKIEGYAIVYLDGDHYRLSEVVKASVECAVKSIPIFEGSKVAGIANLSFDLIDGELPSGMEFRIQHLSPPNREVQVPELQESA